MTRRRPRLSEPVGGGKRNRAGRLAALAVALGSGIAPALPAAPAGLDGVWHVGPVPDVRAICHAGDSLWVGTGAGLFIFDIRNPARAEHIVAGPRLPSNAVRAIASRGDSVFVGTDAGLVLYRAGNARVFPARGPGALGAAPLRYIQHVSFGARGELLIATRRGGVGVVTPARRYALTRRDSLLDDDVFDVLDRPGRPRLFACSAGLCALVNDTTFVSFQAGAGIPRGEVRQVVGDGNTAFLRVARRGIYRFDGKRATSLDGPKGLSFGDATSISLGSDGALWVAGDGWVLVRRGKRWTRVSPASPDDDAPWRVIAADGAGAFVGSSGGVVLALNRGAAFRAAVSEGLPAPAVASIRPDGRGSAWFVSGGRVVSADAGARKLAVENSPPGAEAVEISPAGMVVAAGRWTVSRRRDGGWDDLTPDVTETDPAFASVYVDAQERVWVGARSGALYRFDGEIWVRYGRPRADAAALCDARAFPGGGWALLAGTPVRDAQGCWSRFGGWDSTAAVVDLAADSRGRWLAATREGLRRYDAADDAWRAVTVFEAAGAPRAARAPAWKAPGPITAIAFDAGGGLFVGTTDGFACVNAEGCRWWFAENGTGGAAVSDLACDPATLWVGFVEDGFSAIPLRALR